MMYPPILVLAGAAGSGKSAIAKLLAEHIELHYIEGDEFHAPDAVAKMIAGTPLTDEDRRPWLHRLAGLLAHAATERIPTVLTCSALKKSYRQILRVHRAVQIVLLYCRPEIAEERLRGRHHWFNAGLLADQYRVLEIPTNEEGVTVICGETPPQEILKSICSLMRHNNPDH